MNKKNVFLYLLVISFLNNNSVMAQSAAEDRIPGQRVAARESSEQENTSPERQVPAGERRNLRPSPLRDRESAGVRVTPERESNRRPDRQRPASERIRIAGERSPQRVNQRPRLDRPLNREQVVVSRERWNRRGRTVRLRFAEHKQRAHIFDAYFWKQFNKRHRYRHFDDRFFWSVQVSWPKLLLWFPGKWNEPVYYYYGTDHTVYYSHTYDCMHLVPVASNEKFLRDAIKIVNKPKPLYKDQGAWMPLGMFALSQDAENGEMPEEYLSLAISKDGAVSGAYINAVENQHLEVEGSLDEKSQRVVWKFAGQDWPIMESGLYNLSQEETSVLVHYSNGSSESRLIIRLNQ